MKFALTKTWDGVSLDFYIRHLGIGLLIGSIFFLISSQLFGFLEIFIILYGIISTVFFPYAIYGLEKGVSKLFDNEYYHSNIMFEERFITFEKLVAMVVSWMLTLIVAPLTIIHLYLFKK